MRAEVSETNKKNHEKTSSRRILEEKSAARPQILENALQTRFKIHNIGLRISKKVVNINHFFLQE